MTETDANKVVTVTRKDLPLHCAGPDSSLWDGHPRVYIPLEDGGKASCSYCGATYQLLDNESAE